jgi:Uma2 family endonuclease
MSVATQPLTTYEELCRKREEDGVRYELIEGELVVVAAPSPWHQRFLLELAWLFRRAIQQPRLGAIYVAPVDVRLPSGSIVQPDLIVVLKDRSPIVGTSLIEGVPSLLVEVTSPSSRANDRKRKANLYAANGVPEYWIADPDRPAITVSSVPADGAYRIVRRETALVRSATILGLTIDLAELLAGLGAGA